MIIGVMGGTYIRTKNCRGEPGNTGHLTQKARSNKTFCQITAYKMLVASTDVCMSQKLPIHKFIFKISLGPLDGRIYVLFMCPI